MRIWFPWKLQNEDDNEVIFILIIQGLANKRKQIKATFINKTPVVYKWYFELNFDSLMFEDSIIQIITISSYLCGKYWGHLP